MLESDYRLFRTENLRTSDPQEARMWVDVYDELTGFLRRTGSSDSVPRLRALETRLAFWEERLGELSAADLRANRARRAQPS